jgi:hypothetical protein
VLISYSNGQTSVILRVKIRQSTTGANPGQGLTGLTGSSSGLIISTIADTEASPTVYSAGGSSIGTIATLGAYVAPAGGQCNFAQISATNNPGIYELQLANARFAVSGAKSLLVSLTGASNMADCDVCVPLQGINPYDGIRGGMTALPNAAINTVGGFGAEIAAAGTATSGGANTLTNSGATMTTNLYQRNAITIVSGTGAGQTMNITSNTATVFTVDQNWITQPDNTSVYIVQNTDLPATNASGQVTLQSGSGAGQISLVSGAVLLQTTQTGVTIPIVTTVGSVSGAVGSVTGNVGGIAGIAFPANFTSLSITGSGYVALDLTQTVPLSNTANTIGDCLNASRAQGFGKWVITGTQLQLFAADGTTVVRTFTLDSATAPTMRT